MKKTAKTSLKIIAEIALGFLLLICIGLGLLAWRLSQGPIILDNAVPYIVDYFNDNNQEQIQMDSLVLKWDGFENPLGLTAKNVVVSNTRGPFLFSPEIDLNIGIAALAIGKIDIKTVWVRQIILSITKHKNGQFSITGQQLEDDKINDTDVSQSPVSLNDLIYDLPDLDYFWIDEARIVYRDQSLDTTKIFDPVTLYVETKKHKNERSLSGFLSFPFGHELDSNVVMMNFETSRDPLLLNVFGSFERTPLYNFLQFAPPLPEGLDINMIVDANVSLQLDNSWTLHAMDAQLSSPSGTINYPLNKNTDSLSYTDLSLILKHDPKDDIMDIQKLSLSINDEVGLSLTGQLQSITQPSDLTGNIKLNISDLPQSYFNQYWPDDFTDNGAYTWLTKKIKNGTFPAVNFGVEFDRTKTIRNDSKPLPAWLLGVNGRFEYSDLIIDYNSPMAEATNASGTGTYEDVALKLNIKEANVGGMNTKNAELYFDDLITSGAGVGKLTFPVNAKAQDVFNYIGAKPISAFDNIEFKPLNTKGNVDAVVDITIPLLKDLPIEDVKVVVTGKITDAEIPNAVRGLTLSGGPYQIEATTEDIKVTGSGQIAGQPITLDWHEYYSSKSNANYISKINASLTANETIRKTFLKDYSQHFSGATKVKLDYLTKKNGRDTDIGLDLDLSDTQIIYNQIGLNKVIGEKTRATLNVNLENGDLAAIRKLNIEGDALSMLSGDLEFETNNGNTVIKKGALNNLAYNKNNVSVLAAVEGNLLKTNITGSYLDITPLLKGEKDKIETAQKDIATLTRPVEIGIIVNEMQTAEASTIKQPKIYARLNRASQIEQFELDAFLGTNQTDGQLYIRYTPNNDDGLSLRVESDNAGELFRSFDLYPYLQGGNLQIAGKPVKGGRFGDVQGKARIDDFEVMNAPVLLRLVNALSFQSFMQAGALRFSRLESDFEWQLGETGDTYKIANGRTSGASVALTFDGYVDTANDNMRIAGTAAPLSELNKMIGNIPIVGQILTGGGALLAATYTISGDPEDPSVSVNPLSVLAPGIVRKMLFENNPTLDTGEEPLKERKTN